MTWHFDGTRWRSTEPPQDTKAWPRVTVPECLAYEEHRDALNEERERKRDAYIESEHGGFGGCWSRP